MQELPETGRPWDDIRSEMVEMRGADLDWKAGRHGAFVWYANEDLEHVVTESYAMFLVENGLGVKVFPSIGRMEAEVLSFVRGILHGDDETASIFTSGGTESIFQGMLAMREWARTHRPGASDPEVIAPHSAHPALNKAAHLQGFRVNRIPVGEGYAADVAALEAAITPNTIGVYASAPTYSLGIVDPIRDLGAMAEKHGLWFHVDACVGGILGNFVREAGYEVPEFDFAVPGVTSISADLHKSGFAAKPASTINFRTREHREFARYTFNDWPSGTYSGLTFTGTRPGGAIAAAWGAMNFLGKNGYKDLAVATMKARDTIQAGLKSIEGVSIHGAPPLYAFAYGHSGVDMHKVAGYMNQNGWYCGSTTSPIGIHVMATPVHQTSAEEYVAAIADTIGKIAGGTEAEATASYT
jgi:sphinganine-1-phosphate aldolase